MYSHARSHAMRRKLGSSAGRTGLRNLVSPWRHEQAGWTAAFSAAGDDAACRVRDQLEDVRDQLEFQQVVFSRPGLTARAGRRPFVARITRCATMASPTPSHRNPRPVGLGLNELAPTSRWLGPRRSQ